MLALDAGLVGHASAQKPKEGESATSGSQSKRSFQRGICNLTVEGATMAGKERPLSEAIRERRATPHFDSTPIPDDDLRQIIQAGLESPSGYNLQPWRFVVVRDPEQRKRFQPAAMNQPKVGDASVVIVACADPKGWSENLDEVFEAGLQRGMGSRESTERMKQMVQGFLGGTPGDAAGLAPDYAVWLNRHTMIAVTTMMWMAECLGYDTAPMEGFMESEVRQVLAIPEQVRVVALLALGKRKGPDKPYAGRLPMERTVFAEKWGSGLKL
jgi:nitroreductase